MAGSGVHGDRSVADLDLTCDDDVGIEQEGMVGSAEGGVGEAVHGNDGWGVCQPEEDLVRCTR